ncbi:MAG: endonuclease V, partial [Flavobacterium sp.]
MILAFDTYYFKNKAKTICVEFCNWTDPTINRIYSETLENIEVYVSGEFYKRELPCILSLLQKIDLTKVEAMIVDGYVYLDDEKKYGLGGYLYEKLSRKIPIIGVAKTNFAAIEIDKKSLLRGQSVKPLFITAIGIDVDEAVQKIKLMDGGFRMPTLLKEMDRLTKENLE